MAGYFSDTSRSNEKQQRFRRFSKRVTNRIEIVFEAKNLTREIL